MAFKFGYDKLTLILNPVLMRNAVYFNSQVALYNSEPFQCVVYVQWSVRRMLATKLVLK